MTDETQKALELETVDIEHHIQMGEAWIRLKNNPDFKKVIMDGYLGEKVEASVSLLAVPQIKDQGKRGDIMEDLISASNLRYFFGMVEKFYESSKDPILSDDEIDELKDIDELHENSTVHGEA